MSDKSKGWVLVAVQFILLFIIVISSAYEFKLVNRALMPFVHYIGVTLILIGTALFMLILINFGQYMTPNPVPRVSSVLKTSGVYKFIRHPMYFTVLIIMLGVVMYFQAFYSLAWLAILFLFFIIKSSIEEGFLLNKFPEYSSYRASTKRIIPFLY